jgi:hypothetical protein
MAEYIKIEPAVDPTTNELLGYERCVVLLFFLHSRAVPILQS